MHPNTEWIEAILSYPAPNNQRQLHKFTGTCNFQSQFISNYAQHVEPWLVLLRKGDKLKWDHSMQKAFKNMREKVALSIHLVQPDDSHDYIINTDTSNKAISAVLMQKNELGHVNIISTASRVLTPPERRYTTRALELLAIIFALRKLSVIYDCCVCIQYIYV